MNNIQLIIPMAGKGHRFVESGYKTIKPLLPIGDRTMIELVISNLNSALISEIVIVAREEHVPLLNELPFIMNNNKIKITTVTEVTEGPAVTCNHGLKLLDLDRPLLIANSDQYLNTNMEEHYSNWIHGELIFCMEDSDPKWSYVKLNQDGKVHEIREKQVISNLATCGVYGFSSGRNFESAFKKMVAANDRTNGEFYVAPVYNYLENTDKNIEVINLGITSAVMHGLGTPIDYENFLKTLPDFNFKPH